MGHRGFTTKRYLWISRPLWATYVGTPEQNPSSILISELIKVRNWVVEKFDGISPGLVLREVASNQKAGVLDKQAFLDISKKLEQIIQNPQYFAN